jgi:lysylphosphatidylglycerol synthetase-like protein (DUF2156 family)
MSVIGKTTLHQQAAAVDLMYVNHRGHVANLANLVDKGRRSKAELDLARLHLPALKDAATTLKFFAVNGVDASKLLGGTS